LWGVSCSDNEEDLQRGYDLAEAPVFELKTNTDMGSIATSANMLVGGGQDGFSYLWDWQYINEQPQRIAVGRWYDEGHWRILPLNKGCALMSCNQLLYVAHENDGTFVVVRDINEKREVNQWSLGKQWLCEQLRSSRNGKFVALRLEENFDFVLEGRRAGRTDKGRHRLGIINSLSDEIKCVWTIYKNSITTPNISSAALSEDGRYLAAVGADNGGWILLADVEGKKVLWQKVPHGDEVPHGIWTVNFNDVCFSADGKYIYVAGNLGLFCFDVATGKILSQWQIEGRFVSLDVSADGRLVVGGTEISGDVYVYDARTGRMLLKLLTGQFSIYGLAFSPDSKLLATSGVKNTNIKIWKMPAVPSESTKEETPTKGAE
jgi:WD40 repeat protein